MPEQWMARPSYTEPETPRAKPSITKPQRSSFLPQRPQELDPEEWISMAFFSQGFLICVETDDKTRQEKEDRPMIKLHCYNVIPPQNRISESCTHFQLPPPPPISVAQESTPPPLPITSAGDSSGPSLLLSSALPRPSKSINLHSLSPKLYPRTSFGPPPVSAFALSINLAHLTASMIIKGIWLNVSLKH